MQAHVDGNLKLELPEEIVRRLRLEPNSILELTVQNNKLVFELEPEEQGELVLEGKLLVYRTHSPQPEIDLNEFIERMREERIREQGGEAKSSSSALTKKK